MYLKGYEGKRGVKDDTQVFGLSHGKRSIAVKGDWGTSQQLTVRPAKFEITTPHPSGDAK